MSSSDTYEDRSGGYHHDKIRLASNIKNDPDRILTTQLLLICPFCMLATPIEWDMELHLYEEHKPQLLWKFPGKKINDVLEYVVKLIAAAARRRLGEGEGVGQ